MLITPYYSSKSIFHFSKITRFMQLSIKMQVIIIKAPSYIMKQQLVVNVEAFHIKSINSLFIHMHHTHTYCVYTFSELLTRVVNSTIRL